MLTRHFDIRLHIQVGTARRQVHGLRNLVLVLHVLLSGNHVDKLNQVDFLVINDFVPLVSFKQLFDPFGDQELDALACMFRGLHIMIFRVQTRMGEVKQLIIQALDIEQSQVDRFSHLS